MDEEEQEILNSPNNTLGIEYIKAGMMFHSPLDFYTIQREGQAYHDTALLPEKAECFTGMASASAIRALVESAKGPASANGPGDMPAALRSMVGADRRAYAGAGCPYQKERSLARLL